MFLQNTGHFYFLIKTQLCIAPITYVEGNGKLITKIVATECGLIKK